VNAGYIADTWHITDALKFDVAGRIENDKTNFILYTNSGSNPYPNMAAPAQTVNDSRDHFSWTTGLDYRVNPGLWRVWPGSRGWFNPVFDDFRNAGAKPATAKLTSFELGVKVQQARFNLFLTAFHNEYRGANAGDVLSANLSNEDINSNGVELDGRVTVVPGLTVSGNATYQKSKIVASTTPANIGHEYQRQPQVQLHVTPAYETTINGAKVSLYGTYALVGRRFADNGNTVALPSYSKVDLGASAKVSGVELTVSADNLFNAHGLTEGDPRNFASANARPIFGRSFKFTVGYKF
jgi:outer membrane receptor protein involved in Fe transport